ncbi:MAG: lipoyl(octanoyl) transferase LipB [Gammaproteobacteria bacterium]|nr:lipoyl(octanoyl) transferase LipB [Gammaproteobacteria bacterium]MDJ0872688.1 lipoyl(octanoyl) transferase LipB [Gammaproteobacteria bacterium]MDJ0893413.1 lipoyl(octanoyl) transferase LipB [Gammaproteobacteria bacterium]
MTRLWVRHLGQVDYQVTWRAMQSFTAGRTTHTPDEIWFLEHPPVYTLGRAGRPEHLLAPGDVPVVQVDRGGQVTYHGPGQLVAYVLLDLVRLGIGVRRLVELLEQASMDLVGRAGVPTSRREGAPGVYANGRKLAALGLRVRRGCTYHGLAINVDMDLSPFQRIDPCGFPGLQVTTLRALGVYWDLGSTRDKLREELVAKLGYPPGSIRVSEGSPDADRGAVHA